MALATADDVEIALGRAFTEEVDGLLEEATDHVLGYLGRGGEWSLDEEPAPPDAVVRVIAAMVAASLNAPAMIAIPEGTSFGAGTYTMRSGGSSRVWLTNGLKVRLRPYRRSMQSVGLRSELYEDDAS